MTEASAPFRRLASFYFTYFAAVGILMPYLGLFLLERGCTPLQIGLVNALLAVMRIFMPYAWGTLADRTERRMSLIQQALLGASVGLALLWFAHDFLSISLLLILYGLFINGTMAQFEVVTFRHLAARHANYSRLRLWASAGNLAAVLLMGVVFDAVSLLTLPLWVAGGFFLCWVCGTRIPEPPPVTHTAAHGGVLAVLRRRPVQALLAVGMLVQLSNGPFNTFFSIYLEGHGYSRTATGVLWAAGVAAEVVLFRFVPRFQERIGLRRLMLLSLAALSLRWVLQTLWVDNPPLLFAVQTTQALSTGINYLASVALIQQMFPTALQGRGQALYFSLANGLGGVLGALASGMLWEAWPTHWIWIGASAAACVAWFVAWHWLHPDRMSAATLGGAPQGATP